MIELISELLGENTEDWVEQAICAQVDPELFYPEKGASTRDAKRICHGCEVKDACLEYALEHDERFGIWGGKSEKERRQIRLDRTGPRQPRNCMTADDIDMACRLSAAGWSSYCIANHLGWSNAVIRKHLARAQKPA